MAKTERLGELHAPSSRVVIIDPGGLALWSHAEPPLIPEGHYEPHITALANGARDLRLDGPDAAEAAERLELPLGHAFDVPLPHTAELEQQLAGLDVKLTPLTPRPGHAFRASLAVERKAAEFTVHGVTAIATGDLPNARLPIVGERRTEEPFSGLWSWVAVQLSEAPIARSEPLGDVGVDHARLSSGAAMRAQRPSASMLRSSTRPRSAS